MITPILWFASCSVACLFGFIVGRNFRDFEAMALLQDNDYLLKENEQLRNALCMTLSTCETMQKDLEVLAGKRKEVSRAS